MRVGKKGKKGEKKEKTRKTVRCATHRCADTQQNMLNKMTDRSTCGRIDERKDGISRKDVLMLLKTRPGGQIDDSFFAIIGGFAEVRRTYGHTDERTDVRTEGPNYGWTGI